MKKTKLFFLIHVVFFTFFFSKVKPDPVLDLGKDIFLNKGMCSTCHALSDAESKAMIGPNLDQIKPLKSTVLNVVKNGIGIMPAYEDQLSVEEIEAVAHYVSTVSNDLND